MNCAYIHACICIQFQIHTNLIAMVAFVYSADRDVNAKWFIMIKFNIQIIMQHCNIGFQK